VPLFSTAEGVKRSPAGHRPAPDPDEPALWKLVGNTPLIPLKVGSAGSVGSHLFVKAEWFNPAGSVKDRPARHILRVGVRNGYLPARRLLDASSGNTAVAYAALGAAAGVGVTVCVPSNVSSERRTLLRTHGAELLETDPLEGSDGAIRQAREMAERSPERYWYADQYGNPANPAAHYETTGPEIWQETRGTVTHLVAGLGTSGTLMGTGTYLKERNADIVIVGVQPSGPFHGLEGMKHLESALVPAIYDPGRIDRTIFVDTESADERVRALATSTGLFVGWSSGAAIVAAERVLGEQYDKPPVVVVVAPDGGSRYLSENRRLFGSDHGSR
jgi:cysteine synthase B